MVKFPFYARLALTLFAIALIFLFMWMGKSLLVPLFFSFLTAILLHPLVKYFESHRFPRALASITALLIFMILLGGLLFFFSHQVVRLSKDLPSLQAKVSDKWQQIQ
ncbi:MAG TPA: AI-2E family transporter, partial [Puia sp.]